MNTSIIFATLVKSGNFTITSNTNNSNITTLDTQGYIILAVMSWFWCLLNLLAYRTVQREPSYVQWVWTSNTIGLFTIGILSSIGLKYPSSLLLGDTTFVIFFLTISLFGGCCCLIWAKLCYQARQSSRTTPEPEIEITNQNSDLIL